MAATAALHPPAMAPANPKPLRVCFSYAAYAKSLIDYLSASNIPVEAGLSDAEVAAVESAFGFTFPPDLRSILHEGLPVGPGFPNWRSSSKQQLEIAINLPVLGICKEVSRSKLWIKSWGDKPDDIECAARLAGEFLKKYPVLVPIYRHFYIPSAQGTAGNPVFHVHGGRVKLWSFDISGFFQQVEFRTSGVEEESESRRRSLCDVLFAAPAWAAKEARRIEFWTEMAESAEAERSGLVGCLEEVRRRLRDGGWKEEEIGEMTAVDGCDELINGDGGCCGEPVGVEHVELRVRALSGRLLRAGWSREDVKEALGYTEDFNSLG